MENSSKPKGGAREGAGRKTKHEEDKIVHLATNAIIKKYGSLEQGLIALLASQEPSLMKFVWEHAVGKPKDTIDLTSAGKEIKQFTLNVKPDTE